MMTKKKTKKKEEKYITGTGQKIICHSKDKCQGQYCVIHNPSDHHMKDWPTHWRDDRKMMERICPHGVGHPDPDDLAFKKRMGINTSIESIHGCDGCCSMFRQSEGAIVLKSESMENLK